MGRSHLAMICLLGVMASPNSLMAADLYRDPGGSLKDESAYAPAFSWTGFYIGANGGYAWPGSNSSDLDVFHPDGALADTGPLPYTLSPEGEFAGLQLGYNLQRGHFVWGVEADIQAANIGGSSVTSFEPDPFGGDFDYLASTEVEWFGTLRARLGYSFDRTLIYLTGGFAFGEVSYDADYLFQSGGSFGKASGSETATGYVIGGGIEHALGANWSLKVEYQYIDLGTLEANGGLFFQDGRPSGETIKSEIDTDFHTVRVGLNYRFGSDEQPLK